MREGGRGGEVFGERKGERDNPKMSPYVDGNVSIPGSLRADSKQADLRDEGGVTHCVLILNNR